MLINTSGLTSGQKRCAKLLWPNLYILREILYNADLILEMLPWVASKSDWVEVDRILLLQCSLPHQTLLFLQHKGPHGFPTSPSVHCSLSCCMRYPPLRKFVFLKEEHCLLLLLSTFTQSPYSARWTQGSNLLLICEYTDKACLKSFFLPWSWYLQWWERSYVSGSLLFFWFLFRQAVFYHKAFSEEI